MNNNKQSKKICRAITLILTMILCLMCTACKNTKSENDSKTITLTDSGKIDHFYCVSSPSNTTNRAATYWSKNFYDTLVTYDDNGNIIGELAERWEISPDGKTYTFYIRDNINFSDGTKLTAEAVEQSIDNANINLGAYLGSYGYIGNLITPEGTKAIDSQTFELTLTTAYNGALNDLTFTTPYGIVNPKAFEGGADKASANCKTTTMGTGPYMYGSATDDTYTFVSNPHYWGEKPDVESFQVKIIQDNAAKILALCSGEIDAIIGNDKIDFDGFSSLRLDPNYGTTITVNENSNTRYLVPRFFDISIPEYNASGNATGNYTTVQAGVFSDEKVRMAVAYAIDQQSIAANDMNELETAAESLFSKSLPNCNVEIDTYDTDADMANQLLEEAGWVRTDGQTARSKNGVQLKIDLCYCNSMAYLDNVMLSIKTQLENVGFAVTLIAYQDQLEWYMAGMMGNFDLMLWPTNGGTMDPTATLANMRIGSYGDPLLTGFEQYFDEGVTISELLTSTDEDRIKELYTSVLSTIIEKAYVVPVTYANSQAIWNNKKIESYTFYKDVDYTAVAEIKLK